MTLWRDGEEMENRKTRKSMEAVARLEAVVDGSVMELGLGHGYLLLCSTMEEKQKESNDAVLDSFEFSNFDFFLIKKINKIKKARTN